jgi:hypothetical protein
MQVDRILLSPDFVNDQIAFIRADTWYRSQDEGRQWRPLPLPETAQDIISHYQVQLILSSEFDRDQTIFVVIDRPAEQAELYISQDGGEQWTVVGHMPADSEREWVPSQALWAAPEFAKWQTLFASAKQDNQGLLYRSTDGGRSWQLVLSVDQWLVRQLVFAPNIELNRPLFALADKLYHSSDGGLTWQALEIPPGVKPITLVISPTFAQDRTLFVGTDQGEVLALEVP